MGVPSFFRWLSRKYPSLVVHCVEAKGESVEKYDTSGPNLNDVEFDNLYLDMNGIIHPCTHPENKPAPKNEEEMMVSIFEYIDRIFNIIRPRKLLYMAIDGVAPRAKMNQQRSRRFRAAQESTTRKESIKAIKEELRLRGFEVLPDKMPEEHFDSNCITPGTPFMFRLAECLRYYVHDRLAKDPGWKSIKVILSDANVPGEGEHKIMDYIRRQRSQPDHDPNTHHCLCGADADLIMLGLATHEPYFTIIREEFKPGQPKPCEICGQVGHEMNECQGIPREESDVPISVESDVEFIFIRINILREYLESELLLDVSFGYDFERAIDDWVFLCFFVGNDFLPHLPSLEIRENAIDRLIDIYKRCLPRLGGYLSKNGIPDLSKVQVVLSELGKVEDEIFKKRRDREEYFKEKNKAEKKRARDSTQDGPLWAPSSLQLTPLTGGCGVANKNMQNHAAANALKSMLTPIRDHHTSATVVPPKMEVVNNEKKRKLLLDDESDPEPEDDVRLWEDGWKGRYYTTKFGVSEDDVEFRNVVAKHYARGLCWVLRYYYQGCAAWNWYFPFHYAPFASDFRDIGSLSNEFEKNTQPFKPLEQLMSVFPAASKDHVPPTWQVLMESDESAIIDFYPIDFRVDLNGKKFAWQGVALLPFVDEARLHRTLASVYPDLTEEEKVRNTRGSDLLFLTKKSPGFDFIADIAKGGSDTQSFTLPANCTEGISGTIGRSEFAVPLHGSIVSPLPNKCPNLKGNEVVCVQYSDPSYCDDFIFPSTLLPNVSMPNKVLTAMDIANMERQTKRNVDGLFRGGSRGRSNFAHRGDYQASHTGSGRGLHRPQIGFQPHSGYRSFTEKDPSAALRMLGHNLHPSPNYRGNASYRQPYNHSRYPPHQNAPYNAYESQSRGHQMSRSHRSYDAPPRHQSYGNYHTLGWSGDHSHNPPQYRKESNFRRNSSSRGYPPDRHRGNQRSNATSSDGNWENY